MSHEIVRIILLLLFGILFSGALIFLVKILFFQYSSLRKKERMDSNNTIRLSKMLITVLMIIISMVLLIFSILVFGYPGYKISSLWKLIGGIGIILYWFIFSAFILGLGYVVGIAGISTPSLFREVFGRERNKRDNFKK